MYIISVSCSFFIQGFSQFMKDPVFTSSLFLGEGVARQRELHPLVVSLVTKLRMPSIGSPDERSHERVLPLHHPVVVLGPGQLVHNAVALLPMRVEIIDSSTFEVTNLTSERLQFVVNGENMLPQVSGVGKAFVTLVTHLLLDLHMEFSNVILNSIFPFK